MSQVLALNIVFSGNLEEISNWISEHNVHNMALLVPKASREEFQYSGRCRDCFDFDNCSTDLGIFPIIGGYSYGFDISSEGGTYEIYVGEININRGNVYHIINGLAGEPREAEPAEKVEIIKPIPDVTKLSSDDLFKVVSTYDDIHAAAKVELNNRIAAVQAKLE